MKMERQAFEQALAAYVDAQVLPTTGGAMGKFMLGGAMAIMAPRLNATMQKVGIADASGAVDTDAVAAFLRGAFQAQPQVPVPLLGVTFEAADAEMFLTQYLHVADAPAAERTAANG